MRLFVDWMMRSRRVVPALAALLALALALPLGGCSKKQTAEEKADGAYYAVETPGTGPKPTAKQLAKVNYRFYLLQADTIDGQLIQSTYTSGLPAYLRPNHTIKGFGECLQLMSVGESGRMMIPSGLAYGTTGQTTSSGSVLIPANSNLIYYVRLLAVQD